MVDIISKGFVVLDNPPTQVVCMRAILTESIALTAIWNHECARNGMKGKIQRVDVYCPEKNDRRFIVTVRDQDGNLEDISGSNEITLSIGRSVNSSPGESGYITKTLGGGGLALGTNSQVYWDITDVESDALGNGANYYELTVENSAGLLYTVLAGRFIVENTRN